MALPEIDPSRKIVPRNRGELNHPGSCACCGGSDPDRTYVDFGIWYDYEGSVYICNQCLYEAAVTVMGYFTQEQHEALLAISNRQAMRISELETELADAQPILDAVRSLGTHVDLVSVSDVGSDNPTSEVVETGTEEQPEVAELPDSEGHTDSPRTEPSNRGGRTNPVFS
jgi:hypothetical protein